MAEAALTSIAKSSLELFSSLAKEELLLLWNSGKEIKRLEATIETISTFLLDAERKSKEQSVQTCLSRLRDVMYDAEDLFDALVAKALRKRTIAGNAFTKEVRLFFSKSNQLGFMFKVAHQVKSLRESLDNIKDDMDRIGFVNLPQVDEEAIRVNRNKTHYFVHEEDVIGREQDRVRLIDMLLPEEKGESSHAQTLSVVALIGFGGLGKTTLAQLVYNDKRVESGFEVRLWACTNYLSNLEQVLIEIIASKEGRHNDLGLVMLQKKLREIIGGKKFLIVLDDVWDQNSGNWGELEKILRCGKSGSKVLVTTRSLKVAKCIGALEPYFELGLLSEKGAWDLFVKKAFDDEGELSVHPKLEEIGKKIVSRCGKVPLAIITVASLLCHKKREERIWSDFLDNKLKDLLLSSSEDDNVKQILMISYNDLPPNLKLCFAYCSLFPKDYRFDKDVLIRLWLSQGFVNASFDNKQNLEEQGELCFFQLVERCFFQEVREYIYYTSTYHHVIYAKMHDLLHDMAINVAKTESIFLDKYPTSKGIRDNPRHISIGSKVDDSCNPCSDLISNPKTVRTLLLFHERNKLSKSSLNQLLSFRMVRTLDISHLKVDKIPYSIGELIHLRYLDVSYCTELKCLPSSICKLHHLMILLLEGCELLEKLPPKIEMLVSLRQLYIHGCKRLDRLPSGLRHLTSLVNLDRLIVHRRSGGLRYLNRLDNLSGHLKIELPKGGWPDAVKDAEKSDLLKKQKLNGMFINWKTNSTNRSHKMMANDEAKIVLEALCPHRSLEYLKLSNYGGEMLSSWVCRLQNIKELRLCMCDLEYLEDEVSGSAYFPSLKVLVLEDMKNLKGWWRQEVPEEVGRPCLPQVSKVTIRSCPRLKGPMPLIDGIEELCLSHVDVKFVTDLLSLDHNRCSLSSALPSRANNDKLKQLYMFSIIGLNFIAEEQLSHLTSLEHLRIYKCKDLRWVSCRGLSHLTALKELRLGSYKIVDEDDDNMANEVGMPWIAFTRLEILSVATDNHLLEGLQYLTSLKTLKIDECRPLAVDDRDIIKGVGFPSKAWQNLRELEIGFAHKTSNLLSVGIQYLPSLKVLGISNCKVLYSSWKTLLNLNLEKLSFHEVRCMIDVEDVQVEQRSQLRELTITKWAKWVCDIPWKSLGCLEVLSLMEMGDMEHLPDGVQYLTSLEYLWLDGCDKVRSLPKWISQSQLPSLKVLRFFNCSDELERRCKQETGEDWPLICHIERVKFWKSDDFEQNNEDTEKKGWRFNLRKLIPKRQNRDKQSKKISNDDPVSNSKSNPTEAIANPELESGPNNSEPIPKPVSPSNLPPPSPLPTSHTATVVVAPVNKSSQQIPPRQSFVPAEYVPGFDSGDIQFSVDDIVQLVHQWNLSLVGAPMGATISYQAMQQFVATHWATTAQNLSIISPKIKLHHNGLFIFRFEQEEHLLSTLQLGPWMIEPQIPLILRRWHSGMPLDMSCFDQIPVYVTLPDLDVRFWSHPMLTRVASAIGRPILIDYGPDNQEMLTFPRLLVQVSAKRRLLDEVRFHGDDGEVVYQRIQYEWLPPQCPKCSVFGHHCIESVSEIQQVSP